MRTKPQVILVTGDRNWDDYDLIKKALDRYPTGSWVIQGGAKGADSMAEVACRELAHYVIEVPYHRTAGRAGGVLRNKVMAELADSLEDSGHEVVVLAFHDHIEDSRGTANMIKVAKSLALPVKLVKHKVRS